MNITSIFTAALALNPSSFVQSIAEIALQWVNPLMDILIIPVGVITCGIVVVTNLIKCGIEYHDGNGQNAFKGKILPILIPLIIATILASKNSWWPIFNI